MTYPPALTDMTMRRFQTLARLVGNTPMLVIEYVHAGRRGTVYAKSEQMNMTGSIKDRMALHILQSAYAEGRIRPGDTIIEATSGNTGIAFAAIGAAIGHPVEIFMPAWMSHERTDLIASFGARIISVSAEEGGFQGCITLAQTRAADLRSAFLPSQFSNAANPDAHEQTTGPEIFAQLSIAGVVPQAFVAGVGTGGTVMGVGRFLRSRLSSICIHPIEPAESPTLSTGQKAGHHRIQGISDEFIPPVVSLAELDEVVAVHDGDAILMAQKLARDLGLGVGISSGANLAGAIEVQRRLGAGAVVVTVFPDSNKKYLTTDLLHDEPERDGYITPRTQLLSLTVLPRSCATCIELL